MSNPMLLPDYMSDVTAEMRVKSASIRRSFSTHRLSAGENREDLVATFLAEHLPKKFGVNTGLVISHEGEFSNQADLVVVDALNNAPLYASSSNQLWPVEAVYALVEVKTSLGPAELQDSVAKGRKFKKLRRQFCTSDQRQATTDSLFVIWGFNCPAPSTLKQNLLAALVGVPRSEQPDLLVVPGSVVARLGSYLELSRLGQPGSPYRAELHAKHGNDLEVLIPEAAEVGDLQENSLMAWYLWFDSWLRQAGARLTDPVAYLPPNRVFGQGA